MIEGLLLHLVGYGVFAGLLYGIWKSNARRWTRLAAAYRAVDFCHVAPRPNAQRTMQTVVLVGGDIGWNSYRGVVAVGVTLEGVSLRLMPPFAAFHPPLLIPFADLRVEPTRWYLLGKSFQLTLSGVSDVRIIIDEELLGWIESQAAELVVVTE